MLKVFMSQVPGQGFSTKHTVNGFMVTVSGDKNGQAIVIHPGGHEFLIVGYRTGVTFADPAFQWPAMKAIRVERVQWSGDRWIQDEQPEYYVDQTQRTLEVDLGTPQVLPVRW